RMGKGITTDQARRAVTWAKAAGMTVLTYFMFGNLDETVDDMRRTIDFALELDPDYAEFSITIPYPGTELYQEAQDRGLITHDYWRDYALRPEENFQPHQLIEQFADINMLQRIRDQAVRRFYFRPRYLAGQLRTIRNPGELWRKAGMAWQLLRGLLRGLVRGWVKGRR
ncbi:MAG: hypothetical protein HQK59_18645, partial [Deltaproteobacteria bacterium]|nr:hypothetical protein [Deltaproteobacteria bacterium]